jgi:multicomponent Na+:H+ antiporter subunit E
MAHASDWARPCKEASLGDALHRTGQAKEHEMTRLLLLNLLLAAIWAGFTGEPTVRSFAFGFVLGYLVLLLLKPTLGQTSYHGRVWRAIVFLGLYIWGFIAASLRVDHDVITLPFHMKPGVIRIPLEARTDLEITVFANLISLTPGSLSLDVSRDRSELYVHVMFTGGDVERLRRNIKHQLERRVLGLLRGPQPRRGADQDAAGQGATRQEP